MIQQSIMLGSHSPFRDKYTSNPSADGCIFSCLHLM